MRGLLVFLVGLMLATPVLGQSVEISTTDNPDGTRTMVHEIVIPADAGSVWEAVATPEGWMTWATPLARVVPDTDRFETSYNPAASPGGPDTIEQEWISRDAPSRASFHTTRTPTGFPHAEAYMRTVSTFTLTTEGDGATRVRLIGEGYPPGAAGDALIGFFRDGNRISLEKLRERFVSGPIDWAARR